MVKYEFILNFYNFKKLKCTLFFLVLFSKAKKKGVGWKCAEVRGQFFHPPAIPNDPRQRTRILSNLVSTRPLFWLSSVEIVFRGFVCVNVERRDVAWF